MKKFLAAVLSVVLCLFMAIPAFAADGTPEGDYTGDEKSGDVKISINGDVVHTYLVDIEFTNPTFEFRHGSKWDPNDYTYKYDGEGTWTGKGTVKIVNHSDLPVNYSVTKENVVDTYGPLDITVANGTGTIEKCEVGTERGTKNATATYTVSGTPTVSVLDAQKLGEIKVAISKVAG